jgi:hypothetical protein
VTAPIGAEPPADLKSLALTRGFGHLVASRTLASPLLTGGAGLLLAAVCIGLMLLIGQGVDTKGVVHEALHLIEVTLCITTASALAFGVRSFARGAQSFYVFTGGFVHKRNGKCRAYSWSELDELRPVLVRRGDDAGKLRNYELVASTGRPIAIPLDIVDGRDEFMDQLMGLLDQHGIPVS